MTENYMYVKLTSFNSLFFCRGRLFVVWTVCSSDYSNSNSRRERKREREREGEREGKREGGEERSEEGSQLTLDHQQQIDELVASIPPESKSMIIKLSCL